MIIYSSQQGFDPIFTDAPESMVCFKKNQINIDDYNLQDRRRVYAYTSQQDIGS